MAIITLLALASPSQFTGFEHTRVIDLLTVLAIISVIMWITVCVSIIVRQSVVLLSQLLRYSRTHQLAFLKFIGRHHGS